MRIYELILQMKLLKAQQNAEEWERLKRGRGYKNKYNSVTVFLYLN